MGWAQWFPKIGVLELAGERGATSPRWNVHEFHTHSEFYADWVEYDVRITAPKTFQIASAGEEQGAPVERGDEITRHFVQGDVHDFAFMAANSFARPLEAVYDGPGSPQVKVRVFYPPRVRGERRAGPQGDPRLDQVVLRHARPLSLPNLDLYRSSFQCRGGRRNGVPDAVYHRRRLHRRAGDIGGGDPRFRDHPRVRPRLIRIDTLTSEEDLPLAGTTFEEGKWIERTVEAVERQIEQKRAEWKKTHTAATGEEGPYPYRTTVAVLRDGARQPQTLVVRFEDGSTETASWDDDRLWHRFAFVKPAKATSAEIDPGRRKLLDANKLNDGRRLEGDRAASRRWTADLSAIVETLFALLAAL